MIFKGWRPFFPFNIPIFYLQCVVLLNKLIIQFEAEIMSHQLSGWRESIPHLQFFMKSGVLRHLL